MTKEQLHDVAKALFALRGSGELELLQKALYTIEVDSASSVEDLEEELRFFLDLYQVKIV